MRFLVHIFIAVMLVTAMPLIAQAGPSGPIVNCEFNKCNFSSLGDSLEKIADYLLELAIAVGVIVIGIAGFHFLTAAGNPGKLESAKKMITYAVIGLLIALAAWLIIEALVNTLGVQSDFNPFRS